MIVRKAKKSDLERVYEVFLELLDTEDKATQKVTKNAKQMRKRRGDFEKSVKRELLKAFQNKRAIYLVALDKKEIIGYAYGTLMKRKDAFFDSVQQGVCEALVVKKKYRGKGVAKTLAIEREKWFKSKGCKLVRLSVMEKNNSRRLFESWGYRTFYRVMMKEL